MSVTIKGLLVGSILICSLTPCLAQTGTAISDNESKPLQANGNGSATNPPNDTRYRIGPGDVIEVRVARAPELSRDAVRVDQSGNIRMPMLENDIPAACLTEAELAQNIAKAYRKYKNNPHVDVFVKEFQSQPVAVIGAVKAPAQFKLQRQVRLLELLSLVGGPTEAAGQTVQVVHGETGISCNQSTAVAQTDAGGLSAYKLEDTLQGNPDANPYVRPGDIVQVPQADQIFVLGNVLKPSAIPLKEPITVSRAIAMAGGTGPSTKKDKVRIIRQIPGTSQKQEIAVNLSAIEKNRAEDIQLQPNDIVDVPASATKTFFRTLLGAVVPNLAQLPVRVVP